MLTEILILLATLLLLIYIFSWVRSSRGLPPGPPRYPLIGSLPSLTNGSIPIHKTITEMAKKYGDVLTVYFPTGKGCQPYVVINSYETAYDALITQKDAFSGRPFTFTRKIMGRGGEGLGFADFTNKNAHIRKIVHKGLRLYQPNLEQKILDEADEIARRFSSYANQPFEPARELNLAVINVIFAIVYGERFDLEDEQFLKIIRCNDNMQKLLSPQNILNLFPLLINLPIPSTSLIYDVLGKNIKMREGWYLREKKTFEENNIRHLADALFKANIEEEKEITPSSVMLSDIELQATIDDLILAGGETTTTSLRWLIAYVINFPHTQETLYAEIKEVFGETGNITLKKKHDCHYLEATLIEILRHASVAPMFVHKTTCDTTLSGYSIPKDTTVLLNIWAINHDERHWENPQQFNPGRFLDSNGHFTGTKKMSYMPFGAGRRVCTGESLAKTELFLISATLLQKFKFETPAGCSPPDLSKGNLGVLNTPLSFLITATLR